MFRTCDNGGDDEDAVGRGRRLEREAEDVDKRDASNATERVEEDKRTKASIGVDRESVIKEVDDETEQERNDHEDDEVPDKVGDPEDQRVDSSHELDLLGVGDSLLEGEDDKETKNKSQGDAADGHVLERSWVGDLSVLIEGDLLLSVVNQGQGCGLDVALTVKKLGHHVGDDVPCQRSGVKRTDVVEEFDDFGRSPTSHI